MLSPMQILREAVRAVPAVKYALGIGGLIAVLSIIFSFGLNPKVAFIGAVFMFMLMGVLVIFARMTALPDQHLLLPAKVFTWFVLFAFMSLSVCLFASVFLKWPLDLRYWLVSQEDNSIPNTGMPTGSVAKGKVGWIYVGTRVDGKWETTREEGIEPAKTLDLEGLPIRGRTYRVLRGMNIRETLPKAIIPGERPQMPNSIGVIDNFYMVKVDDVREILITNPTRIWIWAHVTAIPGNRNFNEDE